jgi:alpha-D-xyloside xylohydrolase
MIRRLQLAVFSPMVLVNAWYIKNPPWKQIDKKKNNDDHFIDGYEQIESLCRNIFQWRMRLIPYLYSSMMKYQREGVPPFRAMVMEYPEDVMVYDVRDQYFCGDNLLVAPMVAGEKKRQVYLPSGQWYDFWSNKKYEGGQSYEIYCDLDQFPVFVRGNTILPIAEPCEQIPDPIHFNVEVRVYGQNPLSFTLYEDDGISYQYQKDGFNTMALSWDFQKKGRVARSGNFNAHVYNVVRWQQIQ